ncbi:hypothetical protein BD311DRAFT_447645 [Dichomitus squalens]|uniref:Uncharacterized protein n=1 Tax=Dichomitus squalens TaxID=114155 RepID=A0A4V6MVV9_9APHY|nr:hypothetical protein BD311DRAFT_447645 [Dichomitus squalens]
MRTCGLICTITPGTTGLLRLRVRTWTTLTRTGAFGAGFVSSILSFSAHASLVNTYSAAPSNPYGAPVHAGLSLTRRLEVLWLTDQRTAPGARQKRSSPCMTLAARSDSFQRISRLLAIGRTHRPIPAPMRTRSLWRHRGTPTLD